MTSSWPWQSQSTSIPLKVQLSSRKKRRQHETMDDEWRVITSTLLSVSSRRKSLKKLSLSPSQTYGMNNLNSVMAICVSDLVLRVNCWRRQNWLESSFRLSGWCKPSALANVNLKWSLQATAGTSYCAAEGHCRTPHYHYTKQSVYEFNLLIQGTSRPLIPIEL